jgi:hypothetical protein
MSGSKSADGGNSRTRRDQRRHLEAKAPIQAESNHAGPTKPLTTPKPMERKPKELTQKRNELWNLVGFALGLASWAWSVIGPVSIGQVSSAVFGSFLLFSSVASVLLGIWRVWRFRQIWFLGTAIAAIAGIVAFDWLIVISPQRGKAFQSQLVEGYHLINECQAIPSDTEMPTWMRDQSKAWQSRVQQLIEERLNAQDAQTWKAAVVIGMAKDERMNAYQCLWLSDKVAALEQIIAAHYDPKLKHRDHVGAIYWFNAVNGTVDMTDILKTGVTNARIFIYGAGKNNPGGTGKSPYPNSTFRFDLAPP